MKRFLKWHLKDPMALIILIGSVLITIVTVLINLVVLYGNWVYF